MTKITQGAAAELMGNRSGPDGTSYLSALGLTFVSGSAVVGSLALWALR